MNWKFRFGIGRIGGFFNVLIPGAEPVVRRVVTTAIVVGWVLGLLFGALFYKMCATALNAAGSVEAIVGAAAKPLAKMTSRKNRFPE